MGAKLFGIDLAKTLNKTLGKGLRPVTLRRYTPGTRDPDDPTAGNNPRAATHSARGFREAYKDSQIDGTNVQRGDWKIAVLGDSISPPAVPEPGDELTIDGGSGRIVEGGVTTDPASALYVCQVRAY